MISNVCKVYFDCSIGLDKKNFGVKLLCSVFDDIVL